MRIFVRGVFLAVALAAGAAGALAQVPMPMAKGLAQGALEEGDALLKEAPGLLEAWSDQAQEGKAFASDQECLAQLQMVALLGGALQNLMPFSRAWTSEDERGPVVKLRAMFSGDRRHLEFHCEGETLTGRTLPWGEGSSDPRPLEASTLDAGLGVLLILHQTGAFEEQDEAAETVNDESEVVNDEADAAVARLLGDVKPSEAVPAPGLAENALEANEADETSEDSTLAPLASAPSADRPETPARPTDPASNEPLQPEGAAGLSAPAETAQAAAQPISALTEGQVEGVKLGIQQYWREDRVTRLPNPEELKVVLRVPLDHSGKRAGPVEFVQPTSSSDDRWRIAMQTARIALERAAANGFDLPKESHEAWRTIRVVFEPGSGVSLEFGNTGSSDR